MALPPVSTIHRLFPQIEIGKEIKDVTTYFGAPALGGLLIGGLFSAPIIGGLIGLSIPIGLVGYCCFKS
jgi:hypothetical protein